MLLVPLSGPPPPSEAARECGHQRFAFRTQSAAITAAPTTPSMSNAKPT